MYNKTQKLDSIIKPYLDKIDELKEKYNSIKSGQKDAKKLAEKLLESELEDLKVRRSVKIKDFEEKKELEIQEYIKDIPETFDGKRERLRQNLEAEYNKVLARIISEFDSREKELADRIEQQEIDEEAIIKAAYLESMNILKKDIKELFELRDNTINELNDYYNEVKTILDNEINVFEKNNLAIVKFNFTYDETGKIINIDEFKKITEDNRKVSNKISSLKILLNQIDISINKLREKPQEIVEIINSINLSNEAEIEHKEAKETKDVVEPSKQEVEDKEGILTFNKKVLPKVNEELNFEDDIYANEILENYGMENGNIVSKSQKDLLKMIYNDIITEVDNLRCIKIDPTNSTNAIIKVRNGLEKKYEQAGNISIKDNSIEVTAGDYFNISDISNTLDELYGSDNNLLYKVKDTGKNYRISKDTQKAFKTKLRECKTLKVLENKESGLSIFAKGQHTSIKIGSINGVNDIFEGEYISKIDFIKLLPILLKTDRLEWLREMSRDLKESFRSRRDKNQVLYSDEPLIAESDYYNEDKSSVVDDVLVFSDSDETKRK